MANKDENIRVPFLGDTPKVAAIVVVAAIALLFFIERGFSGISIKVGS